jgi:poly(A) polymerase
MTKQFDESSPPRAISSATLPPLVHFLRDFFLSKDKSAYLVGGVVRDCLLSRQPLDVDIAIEGDVAGLGSELAGALGGRYVQLHQDWDIGRVVVPEGAVRGNNIEYVDLSAMEGGLEADLRRRDFTVDSLALQLSATFQDEVDVLDVTGGLRDLYAGIVRANSDVVFREDPARLLRAIRLASQLGFTVDVDTESKIRRDAKFVSGVAPERVRDELMRILSAPAAAKSIRRIDGVGLLSQVLPELDDTRGVIQPKEHHWDVFNHLVETVGHADRIIATVKNCENTDDVMMSMVPRFEGMQEYFQENIGDGYTRATFLRLTALLHDVAKPATKTVEPSGKMRFLGHHTLGEEMAGDIMSRLRFSRRGTRLVLQMIRNHLRPTQMAAKGEMPSGRALFRYYRDVSDVAVDTLYLNMADFLAARGPTITEADWRDHCELMEYILVKGRQQNAPETLPKIITGHDIMNALSLQPGPNVGKLLGLAHEAQANGDVSTLDEALNLVISLVKSRQEPGGCGA